jgi:hypothetical protein
MRRALPPGAMPGMPGHPDDEGHQPGSQGGMYL